MPDQINRLALSSMIAGIAGWVLGLIGVCLYLALGFVTFGVSTFCLAPFLLVPPIAWIAAVVTGHMGIKQIKDDRVAGGARGMAIVGLISGYLGLVVTCLLTVVPILMAIGVSIPVVDGILREFSGLPRL